MLLQDPMGLFQSEVEAVGEQVSDAAQENGLEFASEVYAGIMTGYVYGDEVMTVFWQMLHAANIQEENL